MLEPLLEPPSPGAVTPPHHDDHVSDGEEVSEGGVAGGQTLLFQQHPAKRQQFEAMPWRRKVLIGAIFFTSLTLFFIILAIASRNVDPEKYAPPKCAGCDVIGSVAANVAQGLLPLVYLGALGASWWMEIPRRSLRQFAVDNMKQLVSGGITHFEATAFAVLMYNASYDGKISECDWYLILFMLDTAYGCFLTIAVHAWTVRKSAAFEWSEPLSRLGDYYGKPGPNGERPPSTPRQMTMRWIAQTMHWTVVAVLMRGLVVGWAYLFRRSVGRSAVLLGSWACDQKQQDAKTFLNIVFFPIIFDAVQVTVQSFALKPMLDNLPVASTSARDRAPPPVGDVSVASFA
mmetsp:Transcript_22914/g.59803  ORF Transcript_22914/g.59803 Transcript_22914/m.59803 type:complete len:345 (+) Transcript_22914:95-1129(+)